MNSSKYVAIVDYGIGNHSSVQNALMHLGYRCVVSSKEDVLGHSDALIFPGVGAFNEAMTKLNDFGLVSVLRKLVLLDRKPILGICLGMQLLAEGSEEGEPCSGLGFIPGNVVKISFKDGVGRLPHVGWNDIQLCQKSPIFNKLNGNSTFYFDHSFHFFCSSEYVSATVEYGGTITAAVQKGNVFGVQFHPEKSQIAGLRLLRGFFDLCGLEGRPC